MKIWQIQNRKTGRTTRMLEYALKEALMGGQIIIVGLNKQQVSDLLLKDFIKLVEKNPNIKVKIQNQKTKVNFPEGGEVIFLSSKQFYETRLNSNSYFSEIETAEIIKDHSVLEDELGEFLKDLHRWDSPTGQGKTATEKDLEKFRKESWKHSEHNHR